jgi:hypothetical protein
VTRVRTLRSVPDPRWGHAPPGSELELEPAEAEALRLAGEVSGPAPAMWVVPRHELRRAISRALALPAPER